MTTLYFRKLHVMKEFEKSLMQLATSQVTQTLCDVLALQLGGKLNPLLDTGQQLCLHCAQALCLCSAEHTQRVELLNPSGSQANLKQQKVSRQKKVVYWTVGTAD